MTDTPAGTGRRARRPVPGPTPLTPNDVLRIVANRAVERPLSTIEITDMCQAAHPHYPNVCNYRVLLLLQYLRNRKRVISLHGGKDTDRLRQLGLPLTHRQWLYWTMPSVLDAVPPLADQAIYDDLLPMADDGREPFPVTHDVQDAPWGSVLELTDSGYPGWWHRRESEWVPIERPARRDT